MERFIEEIKLFIECVIVPLIINFALIFAAMYGIYYFCR